MIKRIAKKLLFLKRNAGFTYKRLKARYKYRKEWEWYLQENLSEWAQHNDLMRNYAWIDFLEEKDEINLEELYPQGDDRL